MPCAYGDSPKEPGTIFSKDITMGFRTQHTATLTLILVLVSVWPALAQLVVHDPSVTLRNAITAAIEDLMFNVQRDQRRQVRRMARRLSMFTDLAKYATESTPKWRIHDFETDAVLFAHDYHAALNWGDATGRAYNSVIEPLDSFDEEGAPISESAWQTFRARLATLNAADAVAIAGTNDAGLLRSNGRRAELAAIEALQRHVIDPSQEQGTTAVLEKISGATLLGLRQRQARIQLMAGILEQLLIDTKRARDTEATSLNMQLTTWRDGESANHAFASGAGEALRTWRQP
jgi:hypothetical protein